MRDTSFCKMTICCGVIIFIVLNSCNSPDVTSEPPSETLENLRTITVLVPDSLSNLEALLETSHIYYLKHMDPGYDNYSREFWEYDSISSDYNEVATRRRSGACKKRDENSIPLCIEIQEHTINKTLNKVIRFNGNGSGYFATINFVYNSLGLLTEYRDQNEVFYFHYNNQNNLIKVIKSEINLGIQSDTYRIVFDPVTNTQSR